LSCLLGLLAGVGLAVWRDRRGLKPFDLAFAQPLFLRMRNGWTSFSLQTGRFGKGGKADCRANNESVAAHAPTSSVPD
jgi:hypothetical protein